MSTSRGPRTEASEDWAPRAGCEVLQARARLLDAIRRFFAARGVLEVETPLLSHRAVTDVHLDSFVTRYQGPGAAEGTDLFLATSPELAMKRLLATGSGPVFQIAKAFRNGERGRLHNPEFTLLEWYRPGFDHHRLMAEVEELTVATLEVDGCERRTYGDAFEEATGLDPHAVTVEELQAETARYGLEVPDFAEVDEGLLVLWGHLVEPGLGADRPLLVFDYPAGQAALARVRPGDPSLAERFELYYRGLELANGFHELADAAEQRRRFEADRRERRKRGLPVRDADERFLAALEAGLPDCSGVALGIDRLLMLRLGAESIDEVLAFPVERA